MCRIIVILLLVRFVTWLSYYTFFALQLFPSQALINFDLSRIIIHGPQIEFINRILRFLLLKSLTLKFSLSEGLGVNM